MTINRLQAPELHPIGQPKFIEPSRINLDNGIPVFLLKAGKQEVCKIDFVFRAGVWLQKKQLVASIANAMLQEGTENHTAAQIAETFDFHGAYLQLSADYHQGTISIICLEKHLSKLMPLIEAIIKKPSFPKNEFETLIKRRKQRFILEMEKVKILCQKKFTEVLFGADHPYALKVQADDFDKLELSDLIEFYHQHYHSDNCEIFVAGNYSDDIQACLNNYFGQKNWGGPESYFQEVPTISESPKLTRVVKAKAIQSAIRIGKLLVNKDHEHYFGLQILTTVLGGYFSSRLMINIREDKGFTYGIGASFISLNNAGYLLIATEVDHSYEEATLNEIRLEIEKLQKELITTEELTRVKQYLIGEFLREFDGPFSLMQAFRNLYDFNLTADFYPKYYNAISEITSRELLFLAQQYFDFDSLSVVISGKSIS